MVDSQTLATTLPNVRDYTPHEAGLYRNGIGLRLLNPADWIEIDERMPLELAERRHLLDGQHAQVFSALPEAAAGSWETLELLVEYLVDRYPLLYGREGNLIDQRLTGERWDLQSPHRHPLEVAGRLVQEDLCLMGFDASSHSYRLTAACLCFPTRWRLAEKMGRSMDAIHIPVPNYDQDIGPGVNRLFDKLMVERPVWRLNWSILDDPALYQPDDPVAESTPMLKESEIAESLWLRVERQTLRRLPKSKDILFTIRVYNYPLSSLECSPGRAVRLAEAVRSLGEDMRAYKNMRSFITPLLAWLDTVGAENAEFTRIR